MSGDAYDLITMDLVMPGMGGIDATELMRLKHGIHTPVIVISGQLNQERCDRLRALGVEHIVAKPFDLTTLKTIVDSALASASSA